MVEEMLDSFLGNRRDVKVVKVGKKLQKGISRFSGTRNTKITNDRLRNGWQFHA
jgi:hypothetical protein